MSSSSQSFWAALRARVLGPMVLLLAAGSAQAATFSMSTADHPLPSSLSLTIDLEALIPGLAIPVLQNVQIIGSGVGEYFLDGSNSGTAFINGVFSIPDGVQNIFVEIEDPDNPGSFITAIEGQVSFSGVSGTFSVGSSTDPLAVSNRDFTVDSSTIGGLNLEAGQIDLLLNSGAIADLLALLLELGPLPATYGLSLDPGGEPGPQGISFSQLTNSILGSLDQDATGFDPDGAEFNLPLTLQGTLDAGGIPLPLTAGGALYLGSAIPEANSISLIIVGGSVLLLVQYVLKARRLSSKN